MTDKLIGEALSTRLLALGVPTAFENAPFTPVSGTLYLEESFMPASKSPVGLSFSSSSDHIGIYQVLVRAPSDEYKEDANTMAETVLAQFARQVLVSGSLRIVLERAYRGAGQRVEDRWVVPVTVNYRAFTK